MSQLEQPGERASLWEKLGDLARRVGKLEAVPQTEGWRFNVDNEGGWGYVVANDSADIDFGELGMVIGETTAEGLFLFSRDPGNTKIGSVLLTLDEITLGMSSSLSLTLDRATGKFTLRDSANNPLLQMTDGSPDLHIPAGGTLVADL